MREIEMNPPWVLTKVAEGDALAVRVQKGEASPAELIALANAIFSHAKGEVGVKIKEWFNLVSKQTSATNTNDDPSEVRA